MKPEIAKIWCDALESNEYEQGKGQLGYNQKYCCLGVLCELAIKNGIQLRKDVVGFTFGDGRSKLCYCYDGKDINLPVSVRAWAGIDGCEGSLKLNGKQTCLSGLNDAGMSFTEIAQIIKDHVEEL